MDATGRDFREAAQIRVEGDIRSASWLAVEERARWNHNAEHFLQAHCLGAELDFISTVRFRLAALVFDGERTPESGKAGEWGCDLHPRGIAFRVGKVKLHHVRDTGDAEPPRDKADCRGLAECPSRLAFPLVHTLVQHPSIRRESIFLPCALHMDKRTLPLAEEPVLQGGEHDQVFIAAGRGGIHGLGGVLLVLKRAIRSLMKQCVEKAAGRDAADPDFGGVAQNIFVAPGGDFLV